MCLHIPLGRDGDTQRINGAPKSPLRLQAPPIFHNLNVGTETRVRKRLLSSPPAHGGLDSTSEGDIHFLGSGNRGPHDLGSVQF